ncbi:MAG TPA: D-alanyl-D-alanine carboxypeptidase/D-alanyl-D-alanine endopeptidase [Candidatus Tripitaka californicus]|uniref:D-alanyl-D-alanine carboxypeptidase/D-alanyl-D-alanine endopeptidase n=2 Tax=Candidatus Tripitaka californicus TaxID=3367616 RepID=UPI004025190D
MPLKNPVDSRQYGVGSKRSYCLLFSAYREPRRVHGHAMNPTWCMAAYCLLLTAFCYHTPLLGEESAPTQYGSGLAQQLLPLLSPNTLKDASVGISVVRLPDKTPLFRHNSRELFTVASNMKLFTTASALDYLGSQYQFKTRVFYRGEIDPQGRLLGDIIVRGGGDPNISGRFNGGKVTAVLEDWAEVILQAGIKEIGGDIVADASFFDKEWIHPAWPKDQLLSWYCAPTGALSLNDNCMDIILRPGKNGRAEMELEPGGGYLKVVNSCKVSDNLKKSRVRVDRDPDSGEICIKGEIPQRSKSLKRSVPVDNPPLFFASVFCEVLGKKGIKVSGQPRLLGAEESDQTTWKLLTCTTSTMAQAVTVANTSSQNFYAEQILKTVGAEARGEGSRPAGLEVIKELMFKLGYEPREYQVEDGSGLCRENRFSPEMITDLLAFMYQHKESETFVSSLPVSGGITGSLRKRLKGPSCTGRVKAKTGYISKVCALSGYVETQGGDTLAFSILVNDFKVAPAHVKEFQDSICRVLTGYGNGNGNRKM